MKLLCNNCHHLITRKHVKVRENSACCPECRTIWKANELLNLAAVAQAASLPWFSRIRVDIHSNGDYVIHGDKSAKTNPLRQLLVIYLSLAVLASVFIFSAWYFSAWFLAILGGSMLILPAIEIYRWRKWKSKDVDIILKPDAIFIRKKSGKDEHVREIPLPAVSEVFLKKWEYDGLSFFRRKKRIDKLNQLAAQFGEVPVIHTGIEYIAIGEDWNNLDKRWLVNFLDLLIKIRKMKGSLHAEAQSA